MKKLLTTSMSILLALVFTTSNAQDTKKMALNSKKGSATETKSGKKEILKSVEGMVSDLSLHAFLADFGNIPNVRWEKYGTFDEAFFEKDGKQMKAFYDESSELVGTTEPVTFAELPKLAQKQIKKKYKDYTIDKVIFYEDNETNDTDMLLYGTQFADADNYFVELSNKSKNKNIVLQVNPQGDIFFFKELHSRVG